MKAIPIGAAILFGTAVTLASPSLAPWQRQEMSDPLRGTKYSQFSLDGKFLTAPKDKPNATPTMIVRCIPGKDHHGHTNGKFVSGYVIVGSVINSEVSDNGNSVAPVQFRLDDGKLQSENWGRSTDFSAIFFKRPNSPVGGSGYEIFANLLYAHAMYHKEGTNPQVHKVVLGVNEYLGGEIVIQFDMPDATEVGEACGIVWHK